MKHFILAIAATIFFFANIFAQQIGADTTKISKIVYVSSSAGDDANDGSKDKPFKTFAKLPKKNAKILLKKDDIFYAPLSGFENCIINSYGKGRNLPMICGLRRIKNPSAWQQIGDNLWRLDLNASQNFDGCNPQNFSPRFNNIGAIYNLATDTVYGHLVKNKDELKKNWDFIVSEKYSHKNITPETFRYLHLKLDHNPAEEGDQLALLTGQHGVSSLKNCTVRNIAIKGFGCHGLTRCRGSKIEKLKIDLIGGSILVGYRTWVRFGNGIEFWISDEPHSNIHNRVSYCIISRTFDCGSTIQGSPSKGTAIARDIIFRGNKYYRCHQAFEHWLKSPDKTPGQYIDCKFVGNFAWDCGNNEFNSPYSQEQNFLNYDAHPGSMTIRHNVCYGGGTYAGSSNWSTDFGNNTFYAIRGKPLLVILPSAKEKFLLLYANSADDIAKYREIVGDNSSKITIVDANDEVLKTKLLNGRFKYVKKFLDKKQ